MRKKLLLFVFALFVGMIFTSNVRANLECKYTGGSMIVTCEIEDNGKLKDNECYLDGNFNGLSLSNEGEWIDNWDDKIDNESLTGRDYYENNNECPPSLLIVDKVGSGSNPVYVWAVATESDKNILQTKAMNAYNYQGHLFVNLVNPELLGKKFTVEYVKNMEDATGTMKSKEGTYGDVFYLDENKFELPGWKVIGFKVYNNNKWLCEDGNYRSSCPSDSYLLVSGGSRFSAEFDPNQPVIQLVAEWMPNANIDSQTINRYDLGEGTCKAYGYMWIDEYGGYCNTDDLQYVTCGASFDIPKQLPEIISYFVNILKIATPIILVVVSIISLLKSLAASNEDEIKKTQKSLTKKITAAVMVFFVISIVQFVILKVADSAETGSISDCMSCFLNNDCASNTYYKTNIGGTYYCTGVTSSGREQIKTCNQLYEEILGEYD